MPTGRASTIAHGKTRLSFEQGDNQVNFHQVLADFGRCQTFPVRELGSAGIVTPGSLASRDSPNPYSHDSQPKEGHISGRFYEGGFRLHRAITLKEVRRATQPLLGSQTSRQLVARHEGPVKGKCSRLQVSHVNTNTLPVDWRVTASIQDLSLTTVQHGGFRQVWARTQPGGSISKVICSTWTRTS